MYIKRVLIELSVLNLRLFFTLEYTLYRTDKKYVKKCNFIKSSIRFRESGQRRDTLKRSSFYFGLRNTKISCLMHATQAAKYLIIVPGE